MTYGRLLRYFLGITTVFFAGLWVASTLRCFETIAGAKTSRLEFRVTHGTVDVTLLHALMGPGNEGRLRFRSYSQSRRETENEWRHWADYRLGWWGNKRIDYYEESSTGELKLYDEHLPEEDFVEESHYRKSEIPPTATLALVSHQVLFPIWLPYGVVVAIAFFLHTWLSRRAASRQREILARADEGTAS